MWYASSAKHWWELNRSVIEKECYGIFYGVRLFEDLLDNRPFILKTDHKNLTYLNVTLTGKVLRWKLYLCAMFPERRFTKAYQMHCQGYVRTTCLSNKTIARQWSGRNAFQRCR